MSNLKAQIQAVRERHVPMGVHADQWCSWCSEGKTVPQWTNWPCDAAKLADALEVAVVMLGGLTLDLSLKKRTNLHKQALAQIEEKLR